MTWQLYLASCAAANLKPGMPPTPSPGAPVSVEWDSTYLEAGLVLTNNNRDVENQTTNAYSRTLRAKKPIPPEAGWVYFEIEIVAEGGTGSSAMQLGFLGEYSANMTEHSLGTMGTLSYRTKHGCSMYFSNGNTYAPGSMSYYGPSFSGSHDTWAGGDVIGVAVNGAQGRTRFYKNGVLVTSVRNLFGECLWPAVSPLDNGDKFRLCSIESEFNYPMPDDCRAYGADLVDFNLHTLPTLGDSFGRGQTAGSGSAWDAWTINPAGHTNFERLNMDSTSNFGGHGSICTARNGIPGESYILDTKYDGSNPHVSCRISRDSAQTSKHWGSYYQEHVLDPRFSTLIDNGEYVLNMNAYSMLYDAGSVDPANYNFAYVATFFDENDIEISSHESDKVIPVSKPQYPIRQHRFVDVPPLTRKIRVEWKHYQPGTDSASATARNYLRISRRRAFMIRKVPLAKVYEASGTFIILKPLP